jgi:hypothetical protein
MTDKAFPTRGDLSPEAVRARMAEFCDWFGIAPIKIKVRAGSVYMTDELVQWCHDAGASIDWICLGEVRGMAAAFREKHAPSPEDREVVKVLRNFDDVEQAKMLELLKAQNAGQMTFEAAMDCFKAFVAERRAKPETSQAA